MLVTCMAVGGVPSETDTYPDWNFQKNYIYKLNILGTLTLVLLYHSTMGMLFRVSGSTSWAQIYLLVWFKN
jgi:hypothetical protein